MANTYIPIHIQAVFSVQNRECIIQDNWKDELYKYITGIVHNNNHKLLAVNGMPDHVHILFGLRPSQSISDFRSLNPSPELLGDLMVTLAEMACKFAYDSSDLWEQYYTSAATNFKLALKFLQKHNLLERFKLRCENCVKFSKHCGYGFEYEMHELYNEYYG